MAAAAPDYGPSIALASPAARAHQAALLKKQKAAKKPTAIPTLPAPPPGPSMVWPYVLGGLAALMAAWWFFLRTKKNPRGRRRSGRPFARGGAW
jgi:LPXTG-motif cell wall-anchored protein